MHIDAQSGQLQSNAISFGAGKRPVFGAQIRCITPLESRPCRSSTNESIEPAQSAPSACHCLPGTAVTNRHSASLRVYPRNSPPPARATSAALAFSPSQADEGNPHPFIRPTIRNHRKFLPPPLQRQDSGSVALFLTAANVAVNTGRSSTPTPNRNTNREPDALFMHKMAGEPRPCRSFPKNSLSAQRCTRAPIAHRFQFAQHLWRLTLSPVHAPDSRLPASPWPAARRH